MMKGCGPVSYASDRPLIDGILAAEREAQRLAASLTAFDRALAEGGDAAASLQGADLLRQEAEGLARFLGALAAAGGDPAAAVQGLDLRAQAERLSGRPAAAVQHVPPDEVWDTPAP
ncbi:MAG: hypothetical protein VYB46_11650 [Pseudomonadota bacterium]|nr:hypothetical protein [Pseudomonadota bacterium]